MKAWKVTSERSVELIDMGAQPVAENCVKLKMLTALVGTHESTLYKKGGSTLPLIVGRQGVGMVTEVGEKVTSFKRGDRVFIRPVSPCGKCSNCKNGKKSECEHGYVYGKTEAECKAKLDELIAEMNREREEGTLGLEMSM